MKVMKSSVEWCHRPKMSSRYDIKEGFEGELDEGRVLPVGHVNISICRSILAAHSTAAQLEVLVTVENKIIPGEGEVE